MLLVQGFKKDERKAVGNKVQLNCSAFLNPICKVLKASRNNKAKALFTLVKKVFVESKSTAKYEAKFHKNSQYCCKTNGSILS